MGNTSCTLGKQSAGVADQKGLQARGGRSIASNTSTQRAQMALDARAELLDPQFSDNRTLGLTNNDSESDED